MTTSKADRRRPRPTSSTGTSIPSLTASGGPSVVPALDLEDYRRRRFDRAQLQLRDRYEQGRPVPTLD